MKLTSVKSFFSVALLCAGVFALTACSDNAEKYVGEYQGVGKSAWDGKPVDYIYTFMDKGNGDLAVNFKSKNSSSSDYTVSPYTTFVKKDGNFLSTQGVKVFEIINSDELKDLGKDILLKKIAN